MKPYNKKAGFTLLEAIIALLLAASGLSLSFQSIGGAVKLQAAALEMSKTRIVAESIMSTALEQENGAYGVEEGIAWSIYLEPVSFNENGQELVRIRVQAAGPSGREMHLVNEMIRRTP